MKRFLITAFVATCGLFALDSQAKPAVCKSVVSVNSGFIYKNSAPLRRGGPGTPLIGFRNEPSMIGHHKKLNRGGTRIYDSKGNKIGSCPWASAHDSVGGRFRCTMQTSSLRRAASRTGNPRIYFTNIGTQCIEVPDAGRCYGSVKGRCNQLIK